MEMKEYVSYEVAKLLREKGYNEPTKGFYTTQGLFSYGVSDITNAKRNIYNYISAPSLAQASKWLRESKSIDVLPKLTDNEYYKRYRYLVYRYGELKNVHCQPSGFGTYEESLNEGIKEALKFI